MTSGRDTLISRDEVHDMFEAVAPRYDLLNRVLSIGIDGRWRRAAIRSLGLVAGDLLIDVCGGTGDLALEAQRAVRGLRAINIDFSRRMLHRAAMKSAAGGGGHEVCADAMRLPVASGCAAGVSIGFGIRNVPDRRAALAEFHRVLRAGGRLAVLEFGTPESRLVRGPYLFYLRGLLPRIAALATRMPSAYGYLGDSIVDFPTTTEFTAMLEQAGFAEVQARRLSLGIAVLYTARRR